MEGHPPPVVQSPDDKVHSSPPAVYSHPSSPSPAPYSVPYSPNGQYASMTPMPLTTQQPPMSPQQQAIQPYPTPAYAAAPYQGAPQAAMAPAPAQPMTMAPQDGHGAGLAAWSSPIFDCFNPAEQCFMACFCPCVVFGKNRARLRDPTLGTYDTVNSDCALWSVLGICGLSCIYQWMSRKEIRARYALKGDGAEDAVWTICCPVCALVQEEKEIVLRTTGQRPPAKVDAGYQTQQNMEMQRRSP